MSDAQFESLTAYLWDCIVNFDQKFSDVMAGMSIGHWLIVFILLIAWGAMMMRGLGLKKFN